MTTSDVRYNQEQIILHWLIATMIFFMIGLGLWMVGLPKESELPPGQESVRAFWFYYINQWVSLSLHLLFYVWSGE